MNLKEFNLVGVKFEVATTVITINQVDSDIDSDRDSRISQLVSIQTKGDEHYNMASCSET